MALARGTTAEERRKERERERARRIIERKARAEARKRARARPRSEEAEREQARRIIERKARAEARKRVQIAARQRPITPRPVGRDPVSGRPVGGAGVPEYPDPQDIFSGRIRGENIPARGDIRSGRVRLGPEPESVASALIGPNLAALAPGGSPAGEASPLGIGIDVGLLVPGLIARGVSIPTRAAVRTFRSGGLEQTIPAAGSMLGRTVERALDATRPALGRTPFVKSEAEKAGAELGRSLRIEQKAETAAAQALRRVGRKLNDSQQYALRVVSEGVPIEERAAHHLRQMEQGDALNRFLHATHVNLLRKADKYVEQAETGLRLSSKAPKKLKEADRLLEKVAGQREGIIRELGRLTDETLATRVQAPGRVLRGARFSPEESRLVGAEDFQAGRTYIPQVRGLPAANVRSTTAYLKAAGRLFGGGPRRAVGAGPDDKTLRKAFKGTGLLTGFFKTNVTEASADTMVKAARLSMAARAREAFLKSSTDIPQTVDDIPIKVDASKDLPEEVKRLWDRWEAARAGERIGARELEEFDADLVESLRRSFFPDLDRNTIRDVIQSAEPIPNIRWINRGLLEETELLHVPQAQRFLRRGWAKLGRATGSGVGFAVDALNDINKAAVLYLNPAYGPANLAGNMVLNAIQQGPFALANLPRAARLSHALRREEVELVDSLMGRGLTGALELRRGPRAVTSRMADVANTLVDLVPRRAAFLHEARRAGYAKPEAFQRLLTDPKLRETLERVTRKANDAIIDYDRMTPLERELITRVVFFYPWIRGSARYMTRFPLEHPVQATALAVLERERRRRSDEELGERPHFAQFAQKIGERDVPLVGQVPEVVNLMQPLGPIATTFETGQTLFGAATGNPELPRLAESLTPALYSGIVAATGYDPFREREVEGGAPETFAREFLGGLPPERFHRALSMSEEERRAKNLRSIYPRSREDEIARIFLGSLAPTPFNPTIAAERVKEDRGAKRTEAQKLQEEIGEEERVARQLGVQLPGQVRQAFTLRSKMRQRVRALELEQRERKDLQTPPGKQFKLTQKQRAFAELSVVAEEFPELDMDRLRQIVDQLPEEKVDNFRDQLKRELGLGVIRQWNEETNAALEELAVGAG